MARNVVRSHLGKAVDMGMLAAKHSKVRAAGNAKVNARGDLLGPGGKIVKTKEQLALEYNDKNPKAVERVAALNTPVNEMLSGKKQPAVEKKAAEKPKSDIESLKKFDVGVKVDEDKK